jgi:hypothetical protein
MEKTKLEFKALDFTKADFEQEKTKRICAYCEALKAVADKTLIINLLIEESKTIYTYCP